MPKLKEIYVSLSLYINIYIERCINKLKKKQFEGAAQYVCIQCITNNVISHLNGKAAKKVFGFHFMPQGPNLALQSKKTSMLWDATHPIDTSQHHYDFVGFYYTPKKT